MSDPAALMALASKLHEERCRRRTVWRRVCRAFTGAKLSAVRRKDAMQQPCCVFRSRSLPIQWWDSFLILGVIYSTAYSPLVIVFPEARWAHHIAIENVLDVLFCIDMIIRCRTSFRDHGYDVTSPAMIVRNYVKGWFVADLLSSIPVDRLLIALTGGQLLAPVEGRASRVRAITWADIVSLLRVLRTGRLVRKLSSLNGANFLRVCYQFYLFLMCGHILGLIWYVISIRPLEDAEQFDHLEPWLWTLDDSQSAYFVALRYVCSLHWALSVMTNLKGINAHETRQCLWHEPDHSFGMRVC